MTERIVKKTESKEQKSMTQKKNIVKKSNTSKKT